LASNLIGALVGGLLESLSFVTGIRALVILVGLFYLAAILRRPAVVRTLNITAALRKLRAMAANVNPAEAPSQPLVTPRRVAVAEPSLTQWLWLIILLILLAQPWRTMMVASDGDPNLHWRVGEYMLESGHIPFAATCFRTRATVSRSSLRNGCPNSSLALAGRRGGCMAWSSSPRC